jgi:uncharacterized alkaline shock family protein YloU
MADYAQPTGKTTIAIDVLLTIARLTALNVPGVVRMAQHPPVRVNRLFKRSAEDGVMIEVQDQAVFADLYLIIKGGVNIREVCQNVQRDVSRAISDMVGMQVGRVNIHVEDVDYTTEAES